MILFQTKRSKKIDVCLAELMQRTSKSGTQSPEGDGLAVIR